MNTTEEDICEAVCVEMGLGDDFPERMAERALVWEFCERFLVALHAVSTIRERTP